MGMFDTVTFRYRMPDGETAVEYQTKDLDCEGAFYEISAEGRLLRWLDADELTETGFDGSITVCAQKCYHLYFTRGQLDWIEICYQGDKRWPFDPARLLTGEITLGQPTAGSIPREAFYD
ncbi:hypothetical protein [Pectobacterium versatile]|uniref:hypothetical protein n=1 Tax=Pectobacterium versatile TaxID=2488639 RepID=UPI002B242399|nr:hypothetical protein [Pectobacterium versatile]